MSIYSKITLLTKGLAGSYLAQVRLSHIVAANVGVSGTNQLLMAIPPEFLSKVIEGLGELS